MSSNTSLIILRHEKYEHLLCSMVPALHGVLHSTSTAWSRHCMVTALLPLHGYCPVTSTRHSSSTAQKSRDCMPGEPVKTLLACLWNTCSLVGVAQRAQIAAAGLSQHLWQFLLVLTYKLFIISIVNLKVKVTSIASYVVLGSDMTCVDSVQLALHPSLLQLQFLITCNVQKQEEKAWKRSSCAMTSGSLRSRHMGGSAHWRILRLCLLCLVQRLETRMFKRWHQLGVVQ